MWRSILAVLLGTVVGGVIVGVVEAIGHRIYPPPAIDFEDIEAVNAMLREAPPEALVPVLVAWGLGSLSAGVTAARIAPRAHRVHALIAGGILMIAGLMMIVQFDHPTWFDVAGVLVFLPCAWFGAGIARGRRS